jgi:glutamyl-tRNA synthetase
LPDAMLNYIARLGWNYKDKEFFNLEQAISWFTLEGVGRSPSRLDLKKLSFISKKHLTSKPASELQKLLLEYIRVYKNVNLTDVCIDRLRQFLPFVSERCSSLGEIFSAASFLFDDVTVGKEKSLTLLDNRSIEIIKSFTTSIGSTQLKWEANYLEAFIKSYCEENKLKFRDIGLPLRIIITGSISSPSIVHIMEILGEAEILDRLNIEGI